MLSRPDSRAVSKTSLVLTMLADVVWLSFMSTETRSHFGPLHDVTTGAFGYRVMYLVTWLLIDATVIGVFWLVIWPICFLIALISKNVDWG